MSETELTPKEIGGFRILRRLASGATSDVLLARAEGPHGFQRVVALKILLAAGKADAAFERSLANDVSSYARLSHPAIVKLYDFFSADGQLVMVLEFVDGLPLHKLRAMLAIAGERIDDRASLFLGLRLFSALAAAHAARDPATGEFAPVGHYDINPSNVLVPWDGHVKVGDFGIARAMGAQSDARSGFVKGTYGYIAPEQAAGQSLTVRADVYSAGLILWELLARRKAVQRGNLSDAEILKAMIKPEFPSLDLLRPDIDPAVREAVRRALEPEPDKRGITADEMMNVLRQAIPGEEGRQTLTKALARIRPAGSGSDPLATTMSRAPETTAPTVERVDPEQTAPFAAASDDGGDLGKIAFYGRINLPTRSDAAFPAVVAPTSTTNGARDPEQEGPASRIPTPMRPGEVSAEAKKTVGQLKTPTAGLPSRSIPRVIPRPLIERKPSNFPTVPAPSNESEGPSSEDRPQIELITGQAPKPGPLPVTPPSPRPPPASPQPPPVSSRVEPAPVAETAAEVTAVPPMVETAPPPPQFVVGDTTPGSPPAPDETPSSDTSPDGDTSAPPPSDTEISQGPISLPPLPPEVREVRPAPVEVVQAVPASMPLPAPVPESKPRSSWLPLIVGGLVVLGGAGVYVASGAGSSYDLPPGSSTSPAVSSAAPSSTVPVATSAAPAPTATQATQAASAEPAAPSATVAAAAQSASSPVPAPPVAASSAAAEPSPPPVAPSATAAPAETSTPSPPAATIPPHFGEMILPAAAAGHRVFVDGTVASEGAAPIRVRCGAHTVRIGSAGADHDLDVPCGSSIKVPR